MVDFVSVQAKAVDNETNALKSLNIAEVAHAFGISASWVDASAGGSNTYANQTARARELLDITLIGWGRSLTETLTALLPHGTDLAINWKKFTEPTLEERAPTVLAMLAAGAISRDEAREELGYAPEGTTVAASIEEAP
jgi:phage portal protein BeeE